MDRIGFNKAEMFPIVDTCYMKEISFRFLENELMLKVRWGKMIIQVLVDEAEDERERTLIRTNDLRMRLASGKQPQAIAPALLLIRN